MFANRTLWLVSALIAFSALAVFAQRNWTAIDSAWQNWRYPPPQGPAVGPLGEQILREKSAEDMNSFLKEYQRVESAVNAAQDAGSDVSIYKGRLKDAVILARRGAFRQALAMLNLVENGLPRPRRRVIPASPYDTNEAPRPPIEAQPVKRR